MFWGSILSAIIAVAGIWYKVAYVKPEFVVVPVHSTEPVTAWLPELRAWWKDAVIYQVYLRSYQDSDGDGVGDIKGLIDRLSHLSELGVDAIWISPIHPSPDYDFGYDVEDYYGVHTKYGSLRDFDDLIRACKQRGIKVVLDLVVNHTSDQHPWFRESRSSRNHPKRDWYIWADQPNNWLSRLNEPAWVYDNQTQQYYMHSFFKEQPDLNWRHPEVRAEVKKIMRFWLDKGVAGFRLDLANYFLKDPALRDNPITWNQAHTALFYGYHWQKHLYDKDSPELLDVYRDLRQITDPYEAVLLGEIDSDDHRANLSASYLGEKLDALNLAFNFDFLESSFEAQQFADVIQAWEQVLPPGGQPVYTLSNHDKVRHMTRYGDSWEKARLAAMLLLTLKGTPVLYYGEEIGMKEAQISDDHMQDPLERIVRSAVPFVSRFIHIGRDGCRTPMQWGSGPYAGFSTGHPWVAMSDRTASVSEQREDYDSLLWLYRKLIGLRKWEDALRLGDQVIQTHDHPDVLLYSRRYQGKTIWVALNFGAQKVRLEHASEPKVHLSTYAEESDGKSLRPYEGVIWTH